MEKKGKKKQVNKYAAYKKKNKWDPTATPSKTMVKFETQVVLVATNWGKKDVGFPLEFG